MKTCVIFCAGGFAGLAAPIEKDTLVIAADGGLVHTEKWNIKPDVILGDFDSLGYVPSGAKVFPVEKDDTDAMLAVRHGLAAGCDRFVIYGGLDGERVDHTIANFQTLQYLADHNSQGYLVGLHQVATVIKNDKVTFPKTQTGILSVFCMGADAEGVSLRGLKYNLEQGTLQAGFPLGVSNHFVGEEAEIAVENGSLLLIWQRENLAI